MDYQAFLAKKVKTVAPSGHDVEQDQLNSFLFPFQRFIVKRALKAGKHAIFADCGLGKTLMQLEWANQAAKHTGKPVLILAPLAVSGQTIQEGEKFGIPVGKIGSGLSIEITNYEQIANLDIPRYAGVVIDESGILKNFTGATKRLIIETFKDFQYKLACTATPAPNDLNEIGNHSEFLDVMEAPDMRMRWFVRDEGMNNYRLKGHAESDFFGWVGSWATVLRTPADVGFQSEGYILPPLNIIEKQIETPKQENGKLFNNNSVNATTFNKELRITALPRLESVAEIVNASDEPFIVWVKQNEEEEIILKLIPDAVAVRGNMTPEMKESRLLGFARGEFRVLVTKAKIAQFGLNYQHCRNQIFASLDFSFEGLYQAIRRSYRFGQKNEVNVWLITTDTMENVINTIREKEESFNNMMDKTVKFANSKDYVLKLDYERREVKTDEYHIINGDSCEIMPEIPSDSIDFSVFSPPFSNLFTYSDSVRDLGNCEDDDQFFENYRFILKELYRIMKPGRLVAMHTKDLAVYKNSSGYSGLKDFTGRHHALCEEIGFKYHSKITIWTDPALEMQRTKTQRLLYKQLTTDSTYSGIGMPEYVTIFRKWEGNEEDWEPVNFLNKDNFPIPVWQKWASPVWMDIQRTDVLNNYKAAKDPKDEKHIAPLQLEVIKRLVAMYSNEGETVFTPFLGIGSEVWQSVKMNRKGLGIELKPEYFETAASNIRSEAAKKLQMDLFS